MKRFKLYLGTLMLVLIIMGFAYAAWWDYLKVAATVNTGNIDVKFMEAVLCFDQEKEIASGTVNIINDGKTLKVTIENYYPEAGGLVVFWVENLGSVPVKLKSFPRITVDFPLSVVMCTDYCETGWAYQKLWKGVQLGNSQQCESTKAMAALRFDVPQYFCGNHTMNQTFEFTVEYDFIQWNKYRE